MNDIKGKITGYISKLNRTGFFAIVLSNIFAKVVTFLGGMVLVRLLSKEDYGYYADILNNYGIMFILCDFGNCVAMMQYRSEFFHDKKKSNDYFTSAYKFGMLATCAASLILLFSPFYYPYKYGESVKLTQALFLLPFISTTNNFIQANLRVLTKNKKFALLNISNTFVHYGVLLPFSYFWGLLGAVMANYGIALGTLVISLLISKTDLRFDWKSSLLSTGEKKSFLKFAFASQLNNSIGGMLNLFDIFLIGQIIISGEVIASYKVASTIPQALLFIPNSIIIYIVPYFARNNSNKKWVRDNYKRVLALSSLINGGLTISFILLSPFIIPIIYGRQYTYAISCFIILMIAFFFNGSLYIPSANIIYTQHRVRVNLFITIVSNIVNCVLDVILIKRMGSIGAAYSTLAVSIVSASVGVSYMIKIEHEKGRNE